MLGKKFKASCVFRKNDANATMIHYSKEPAVAEKLLPLTLHSILNVNCVLAEDCHFLVYRSHNEDIVVQDGVHVVTDPKKMYTVVAFLGKEGDVLSNAITLITSLPEGLEMNHMEVAPCEVYAFSGLNVMLFEDAPKA
jgi:acetyltransferase-like isoleucine patch superfamily enzyme